MSTPATYICQECLGEYEFGWSDEEAHAEAVQNFGRDGHAPDMAIVCDDCYKGICKRIFPGGTPPSREGA